MPQQRPAQRSRKSYPIDQCALYKLRNKRRLAHLLGLTWSELQALLARADNYRCFDIVEGEKRRPVEEPKPHLKRLHKRLFELLQRIEVPEYLHSGVKQRSYITNASAHVNAAPLAKLDIRKFYPSTTIGRVYEFFAQGLLCSKDVAAALSKLATYDGHIPTGSPLSQVLAYYSHKPMFDRIHELAAAKGLVMTCYVDDLTFSGGGLSGAFMYDVKQLIHARGLQYHKEKRYARGQPKLVTGVVVTEKGIRVPHKLHKAIYTAFQALQECTDDAQRVKLLEQLLGRCNAANQLEMSFAARLQFASELHRHARKRLKSAGREKKLQPSPA